MIKPHQSAKGPELKIGLLCVSGCLLLATYVRAHEISSVKYIETSNTIVLTEPDDSVKQCVLQKKLKEVSPRLNWDKRIVLLTDTDYLSVHDAIACQNGNVSSAHIPDRVGFVVDVNLKKHIYLSLDAVTAGASTYAATVAKLGDARPIANTPGMYTSGKDMQKIHEEGFGYNESSPGRISPDGRYVSADGSMDCAIYSHPGVWDLQARKKIVKADGCKALFKGKSD